MSLYYDDGQIQIWHGDCRDVLPTLGPVDLVLTDPPYGISERTDRASKGRGTEARGKIRWASRDWDAIHGDSGPFDLSYLLHFPRLALFGANHFADKLPLSPSWIVWDKREDSTPDDNADAELIWTNLGGSIRTYRQCWRGFARTKDALEPKKHLHPTQKPIALMIWLLERFTSPGDTVLDPYMGSGPIAQAANLLSRKYIGVEIKERYCEIAVRRLGQMALPLEVA